MSAIQDWLCILGYINHTCRGYIMFPNLWRLPWSFPLNIPWPAPPSRFTSSPLSGVIWPLVGLSQRYLWGLTDWPVGPRLSPVASQEPSLETGQCHQYRSLAETTGAKWRGKWAADETTPAAWSQKKGGNLGLTIFNWWSNDWIWLVE